MTDLELIDILKAARKEQKLTLADVAGLTGLTKDTISAMEREGVRRSKLDANGKEKANKRGVSLQTVYLVANALGYKIVPVRTK